MIYARLHGRLGNQMFQYAAARALAARLDVPFSIDTRRAEHKGEGVLTRVFDVDWSTPQHLPPAQHVRPLAYFAWRAFGQNPKIYREQGLGYNAAFETLPDNTYLHGYWQAEQYFAPIANDIRAAFVPRHAMSPQNADMAARIASGPSVSLHVRRGDYLTVGAHGLCDQAYYEAALAKVAKGIDAPTVYVFSDDPDWAKDNLPLPFEKVVVDFNGPDTDYEDLRLMSLCQHNVLANSSFSWWGAWLNRNPDKRVAGPKDWFSDPKLNNPDILPKGWLQIKA
ncbi:alpha-1,2-fucosyltransferase [Ascidiaceihabitans sp.]|uniref:alpha-1,2-fucosyltransferase n=1 Tax=Ascidiaceihabitans sp. TaxID=1872644 RepID=UPI00329934CF